MYSQRDSVETDRENIVPGNLCIIWKLNEAWSLKKDSVTFLRLLKLLKLKKDSIAALRLLKFLILKKASVTFLQFLKLLMLKKDSITVLKFLIPKKNFTTFFWLLKILILKKAVWISYDSWSFEYWKRTPSLPWNFYRF